MRVAARRLGCADARAPTPLCGSEARKMGRKHKKHKSDKHAPEEYSDKPLKLVLKVGGSEITELSTASIGHESSLIEDKSDHDKHKEKKKKKKKKTEKEKRTTPDERKRRKDEKKKREKEPSASEREEEERSRSPARFEMPPERHMASPLIKVEGGLRKCAVNMGPSFEPRLERISFVCQMSICFIKVTPAESPRPLESGCGRANDSFASLQSVINVEPESQESGMFQKKLDETTKLLQDLQQAQNERFSTRPPSAMLCLLGPSIRELLIAEKVTGNLKELASQVAPGDITSVVGIRKAMGITVPLEMMDSCSPDLLFGTKTSSQVEEMEIVELPQPEQAIAITGEDPIAIII
uniref:bromodomain-containing protein 7 n=1 Tax=Pristiophorus japonicus TaxID=55135 RepID=UPI00398EE4E1